jgi:hypothetical protein
MSRFMKTLRCGSSRTISVSVRCPRWPARAPGRPRRRRRPGRAHDGRVAPARHGRPWPRRPHWRLRWRRPEPTVYAGSARRGRRPAPPTANRPTVPAGTSLLGVAGSLSTTSSPAAAATTSRLVHGCRNIRGREGAERATTVATPSWPRRPVAAPRNMLPTTAPRRVVGRCLVTARRSRDWFCRW